MGWIFGKEADDRVAALDKTLKESFTRVRQDTTAIYQWLAYFQQVTAQQQQLIESQQHDLDDVEDALIEKKNEIQHNQQLIARLQSEMRAIPKDPETIKRIIDAHYDFDDILERINKIEAKLSHLEHVKTAPQQIIREIRHETTALPHVAPPKAHRVEALLPSKTQALKDKIVQRITRNSKEYLKGIIMNMITKYSKISALQLREMLVEEQGLVSKSSFYRLVEELEDEGAVVVVSGGKEKILMPSTTGVKQEHRR